MTLNVKEIRSLDMRGKSIRVWETVANKSGITEE